jgi:hypothetical protein
MFQKLLLAIRQCRYVAALVVLSVGTGGCVQSETVQVPEPSPATVRIVSVTPPSGSEITKTTTIVVELEYRVEKFEPKRFKAGATAAETREGYGWSLTPTKGQASQLLHQAAGTLTVPFDANILWDKPGLKHPFEITFSVDQLIGTMGASVTAAKTEPILFRAASVR